MRAAQGADFVDEVGVEKLSLDNLVAVLVFLRGGLPVIFEVVAHGGANDQLVLRRS